MAVTLDRGTKPPEGPLVADRHLYLDGSGNKVVEHGDESSASLLAAEGSSIDQATADRLGLVSKDGKVTQDHPVKIADLRKAFDDLSDQKKAFDEKVDDYKKENAVKDIPNTMELERVQLDAKVEAARVILSQAIKAGAGKDAFAGESQTAKPAKSQEKAAKSKGK
jgi:hypothetical protein